MVTLPFEKHMCELKNKINDLRDLAKNKNIDLAKETRQMEIKLYNMQKEAYKNLTAWDKVSIARLVERPTALDYINRIFDCFIELHGDRYYGDDAAIVGGIAEFNGTYVTIIAQQKGNNTKENIKRNFGMPNPEGYRKALRLMKQAEKFNRPVICLVDTPGAYCGLGAEERGQGEAIARNLMEISTLKTPVISIVIGEGGSGGALAMAVADEVWMLEHAVYSILSPEGFASILYKDACLAKEAANTMKITAQDLINYGIIDRIIKEPLGGAHTNVDAMATCIKRNLAETIDRLARESIESLLTKRYYKFRKIGKVVE